MGLPKQFEVVELVDYTADAGAHGFRCSISLSNELVERLDVSTVLAKFRELLTAKNGDPRYDTFRAVALRGEPAMPTMRANWRGSLTTFVEQCRMGHEGISDSGTITALTIDRVLVIGQLGFGIVQRDRKPLVVLSTHAQANFYVEPIAIRSLV